jgi:hypothetical protein
MRAILVNLSQRIAKFQANASASNSRFEANICGASGTGKTNISPDSAGLNETPHPEHKNADSSTAGAASDFADCVGDGAQDRL